jgi:hypothetical protein
VTYPEALPLLLGIREGCSLRVINPPPDFVDALAPLPGAVAIVEHAQLGIDVQVLFARRKVELIERLTTMAHNMNPAGCIWVCIPVAADAPSAPSEDFTRLAALELGLTDVRILVLSADWVALKLKRKGRAPRATLPEAAV